MLTTADLSLALFDVLSPEQLEKLAAIGDSKDFHPGDRVYASGDKAEVFYVLASGRIMVEYDVTESIAATLAVITPGHAFGLAALGDEKQYMGTAAAEEDARVLVFEARKLLALMAGDPALGYPLMHALFSRVLAKFYDRTGQFCTVLSRHPDLRPA